MYVCLLFFFFNDTATTEIYTLSLHDALPISGGVLEVVRDAAEEERDVVQQLLGGEDAVRVEAHAARDPIEPAPGELVALDRKSTRLNSSHANISYAVFCLKKKKKKITL